MILSLMLKLEDRYIGICLVSVTLCLMYLSISHRVAAASYLDMSELSIVNYEFFKNAIKNAIVRMKTPQEHFEDL